MALQSYQPVDFGAPLMDAARIYRESQDRRAALLQSGQHNAALEANAAAELAMQKRQEEERIRKDKMGAVSKITEALDAGRTDVAKQYMQTYGIPFSEVVKHQDPRDRLMQPSSETPDAAEAAQGDAAVKAFESTPDVPGWQNKVGPAMNQAMASPEVAAQQFQPSGLTPPKPDRTTYMIDGQPYDPEQTRQAALARRQAQAEQNRAAFEPLGQGDVAHAMTMAGHDKDTIGAWILKHMDSQEADKQRAADKQAALDARHSEHQDQMAATADLARTFRPDIAERERMIQLQGDQGVRKAEAFAAPRFESTDIQATKAVEQSLASQWKSTDMDKLLNATRLMGQANAALQSDDTNNPGAAQVGARTILERVVRQGIPTAYLDQRERQEVTGIVGKVQGIFSRLSGEGLGEQEKAAYQHELDTYQQLLQGYVAKSVAGIQQTIADDPSKRNLLGTANQWLRGRVSAYGIELPKGPDENRVPAIGSRSAALSGARDSQRGTDASRADALTGAPAPSDASAGGPPPGAIIQHKGTAGRWKMPGDTEWRPL